MVLKLNKKVLSVMLPLRETLRQNGWEYYRDRYYKQWTGDVIKLSKEYYRHMEMYHEMAIFVTLEEDWHNPDGIGVNAIEYHFGDWWNYAPNRWDMESIVKEIYSLENNFLSLGIPFTREYCRLARFTEEKIRLNEELIKEYHIDTDFIRPSQIAVAKKYYQRIMFYVRALEMRRRTDTAEGYLKFEAGIKKHIAEEITPKFINDCGRYGITEEIIAEAKKLLESKPEYEAAQQLLESISASDN